MEQLQLHFRTSLLTSDSIQVSIGGAFKGLNMFSRSLGKMIQFDQELFLAPMKQKTSPPSRRYLRPSLKKTNPNEHDHSPT